MILRIASCHLSINCSSTHPRPLYLLPNFSLHSTPQMSRPISSPPASSSPQRGAEPDLAGVMQAAFTHNSKAVPNGADDSRDDDDNRDVDIEIRPPEGFTVSFDSHCHQPLLPPPPPLPSPFSHSCPRRNLTTQRCHRYTLLLRASGAYERTKYAKG